MTNLDMKAVSSSQWGTVNTDGFDSWNAQDIFLQNWTVTCGDVSLPLKLSQQPHSDLYKGLHFHQGKQHQRSRQECHLLRLRRHGDWKPGQPS